MTENQKTAQQMAEQREISISQFFEKNRHLLGYDNKIKALLTIVKEGVDNALDATEEARILPDVYVKIEELEKDKYKIIIKDNGPGILKKHIPNVFGKLLYGSKFHRLKQSLGWEEPVIVKKNGRIEILPIGELVDSVLAKEEESRDVSNMDMLVPAFDRNTKQYEFRKVSHVIRHRRENEMYRITTQSNRQVTVTGCHSLFRMGSNGNVEEAEARNLKEGDYLVAPKRLPAGGSIKEINILDYVGLEDVKGKWIYVYGVEKAILDDILNKSEIVHKKTDKSRRYFRVKAQDGESIDILDDSMKQYLGKGFLPAHLVILLGLKDKVGNCVLQTYYHGKITRTPVMWELTPSLMRFLGLFVSEGHVDARQIGFTFGKHESGLIDEVCRTARTLGSNVTIEQRESSIRVKIFGNMMPILMEKWCKRGAANKRVPEFVFRAEESLRQHLLDGLYIGDGHMVKNRNQLMHNTISKKLANDIMYLWLMQGVLASITQRTQCGLGTKPSTCYCVSVYGKDIEKTHSFNPKRELRTKRLVNSGLYAMQMMESDICQLKIKKVEIIKEGFDYVYDLSVPTHENFVGGLGGLSCHNSRGQQGIGISGCVLYSQLTTGEPTVIHSSIGDGKTHKYVLKIDVKTNEPKILEEETTEDGENKWHGLQITFVAEGTYREHKQGVLEFLKEVAIANPYANLIFDSPNGRMEFKRSANSLPVEAKEIQPHLDGVEVGILSRMLHETKARTCASFFTTEFSRIGQLTAANICKIAVVDPKTSPRKITQEEVVKLSKATKEVKLTRPPTDCLSPLGDVLIESGLKKELSPEWISTLSRLPSVYRGWPFQIEVGIAYGGSITEPVVMRFANKVPLLYAQGDCAITKAAMAVDWKRYGVPGDKLPEGPVAIFIHMASVWVPFTSESKEAVSSYDEIIREIKLALQDCARRLSMYLNSMRKAEMIAEKKLTFEKYAYETAVAIEEMTGAPRKKTQETIMKIVELKWGEIIAEDQPEENGNGSVEEKEEDENGEEE